MSNVGWEAFRRLHVMAGEPQSWLGGQSALAWAVEEIERLRDRLLELEGDEDNTEKVPVQSRFSACRTQCVECCEGGAGET